MHARDAQHVKLCRCYRYPHARFPHYRHTKSSLDLCTFIEILAFRNPSMSQEQYAPGIPGRVADYANQVKQKFIDNATASPVRERNESAEELPVLPPGVSRENFHAAITELRGLVDNDVQLVDGPLEDGWYLDRPLSHDLYALDDEDYFVNSAVCAPGSVEQTQAVVKWANKWLIPIYAISMGRNLGRSSTSSLGECIFSGVPADSLQAMGVLLAGSEAPSLWTWGSG